MHEKKNNTVNHRLKIYESVKGDTFLDLVRELK